MSAIMLPSLHSWRSLSGGPLTKFDAFEGLIHLVVFSTHCAMISCPMSVTFLDDYPGFHLFISIHACSVLQHMESFRLQVAPCVVERSSAILGMRVGRLRDPEGASQRSTSLSHVFIRLKQNRTAHLPALSLC